MTRHLLLLLITLVTSLAVFAQVTNTIHYNGHILYLIKDNGGSITKDSSDCIFCNAEIMNDRILLDSSMTMIARKTSNPLGYTYYEWRGKKHGKTYEEIQFPSLDFKATTVFTETGPVSELRTKSPSYTTTLSQNRLNTVDQIRVQQNKQATDSLVKLYQIPKDIMIKGTKLWTEVNFYENGKMKSTGIMITRMKEPPPTELNKPGTWFYYKIGTWAYYNSKGQLFNKEFISTVRKVAK